MDFKKDLPPTEFLEWVGRASGVTIGRRDISGKKDDIHRSME